MSSVLRAHQIGTDLVGYVIEQREQNGSPDLFTRRSDPPIHLLDPVLLYTALKLYKSKDKNSPVPWEPERASVPRRWVNTGIGTLWMS